ncbi:MAG: hypothetical protein QNJ27_03915 [Simkaniaceae bacterium]|nr:hypothetical protein [Simkaniaceae bacterium]
MNSARFNIIDRENDAVAVANVQKQLRPQGMVARIVNTIWNRGIVALFSSEQRQLNAARDLLAKPTEDLTKAVNRFASLSTQVQQFGGAPITLENVQQYAAALKEEKILVKVEDQTALNQVRFEAKEPVFSKEKPNIQILKFARLSDGIRIADLEERLEGVMKGKTPMTLLNAAKAVASWNQAIQTAGKNLSDAEFRGLVTQANAAAINNGADREFIESNTVTAWAQVDSLGQRKFVNEMAQEFTEAVQEIDGENWENTPVTALIEKVDNRAKKIAEINGGDTNQIKQALLDSMNAVSGFKKALMEAQESLKTVVANNQSQQFLAREQISLLGETQDQMIDSVKTAIEGSELEGEAAIVGTFTPLLFPQMTAYAMGLAGRPDLLSMGAEGPQGKFVEIADSASARFSAHQEQLQELLNQGNKSAVEKGQRKAEDALRKLESLNAFVNENNQACVAIEATDKPIEQISAGAVAEASREDFLTMIEKLAGASDEEAAPTLLEALLQALGREGQEAVLGQTFETDNLFENVVKDENIVTYKNVTMRQFAGQRPNLNVEEDNRHIAQLRNAIRDIRERQEQEMEQGRLR